MDELGFIAFLLIFLIATTILLFWYLTEEQRKYKLKSGKITSPKKSLDLGVGFYYRGKNSVKTERIETTQEPKDEEFQCVTKKEFLMPEKMGLKEVPLYPIPSPPINIVSPEKQNKDRFELLDFS